MVNYIVRIKEIFDRKTPSGWVMNQTRELTFTAGVTRNLPDNLRYIDAHAIASQACIWMNQHTKTEVINSYGVNGEGFYSIGDEHNPTINPNFTRRLAGVISVTKTNAR